MLKSRKTVILTAPAMENETAALKTKAVTLQDVARAAGVTPALVSMVLSGKRSGTATTRAVEQAAREMGYSPNLHAQRLATGGCRSTIGLFSLSLDLGVGTRKVQLLQETLSQQGFSVPLFAYGGNRAAWSDGTQQRQWLGEVRRQGNRALVCDTGGFKPEALEELKRFQGDGQIVVCHGFGDPLDLPFDQVHFDIENSLRISVDHLLAFGHRRIGFFWAGVRGQSGLGVALTQTILLSSVFEWILEWTLQGEGLREHERDGAQAAARFLKISAATRPTGMCIINDSAALAFVACLQSAGIRVPQEVSVVGHDDKPVARFAHPPLTTASHPVEAITRAITQRLDARLAGDAGAPQIVRVQGELVVRNSTATAPL